MSMVKKTILVLLALAALTSVAAEVVETKFPARDVVIAERVLESQGDEDFAPVLQRAVDAVSAAGGGTVFLRAGAYCFRSPVTVRRGVTVRGDYSKSAPSQGTVAEIFGGRGDENGAAAFSMENGSGLEGLVFFYPEQSVASPAAYPWTVRTALDGRAGNNQTVIDCTFVNSWQALRVGPETNECHTFRRLRITALKTGLLIDMTTDIGRVTDVFVSPSVWAGSGFGTAPEDHVLRGWLKANGATAAEYRRSDWEYIRGLRVDGYAVGVRFARAKVPTNAVMAHCTITDCSTALRLDALNWVGLACYDSAFAGIDATVACADDFGSTAMFAACTFRGAPLAVSARGTLSFSRCDMPSAVDAASGGRIERVDGDDPAPASDRLAAEFPAWPRPKSGRVVFAEKFGVGTRHADNTAALQKALDEAGRGPDGATVYLAAGYYRFAGTLKVPRGVELRGASEVPHHTQNGGTVLLATAGRGDGDGTPFISLEPDSGLRGIGVWYPQQPLTEPVAYPWTIRSLGPGCWLTDVNLGNSWQGVDFGTYPSGGHRISYVSGGFFKTGVLVGNAKTRGWVEDLQFNPHYMLRLSPRLPVDWGPKKPDAGGEHPAYPFCRRELQGIVVRDCADEKLTGTFLYAARDGLVLEGATKACVLIHGTDTGCRGARLALSPEGCAKVALGQFVPLGADAEAAVVADGANKGEAEFIATQIWPKNKVLSNGGTGKITFDQYNACGAQPVESAAGVTSRLGHRSGG